MTNGRRRVTVVDTNVAMVADGKHAAGVDCRRRCALELERLTKSGRVAIDDKWQIIREYRANIRYPGQLGPGGAFLKWLLTNRANPDSCVVVGITPTTGEDENCEEFPTSQALAGFDPADRKFVAVAMAVDGPATILQAVDTEWWAHRDALRQAGVRVTYVCEQEIARMSEQRAQRT